MPSYSAHESAMPAPLTQNLLAPRIRDLSAAHVAFSAATNFPHRCSDALAVL
jgi:hypothetical protein